MTKRRVRTWVYLVLSRALTRAGHSEGVGVVSLAAAQIAFTWLLVLLFGASGAAWIGGAVNGVAPAAVGVSTVFMIFVVAPYQLWREEAERADAAEEWLVPRLGVTAHVRRWSSRTTILLRIRNISGGTIERCQVTILGITLGAGPTAALHKMGQALPAMRVPWGRGFGDGYVADIHDVADIEVCWRLTDGGTEALNYRWGEATGEWQLSPSSAYTWLDISIAAADSVRTAGTLEVHVCPHDAPYAGFDGQGRRREAEPVEVSARWLDGTAPPQVSRQS